MFGRQREQKEQAPPSAAEIQARMDASVLANPPSRGRVRDHLFSHSRNTYLKGIEGYSSINDLDISLEAKDKLADDIARRLEQVADRTDLHIPNLNPEDETIPLNLFMPEPELIAED